MTQIKTDKLDMTRKTEVYEFLDQLRWSGITNMFGAAPYIKTEFGFDLETSRQWLSAWMEDFKD